MDLLIWASPSGLFECNIPPYLCVHEYEGKFPARECDVVVGEGVDGVVSGGGVVET